MAARIPYRGRDEVEEVLAIVVNALEKALIGRSHDIDALGQPPLSHASRSSFAWLTAIESKGRCIGRKNTTDLPFPLLTQVNGSAVA